MKITKASDFAIRLLTFLAEEGGEWTSQELAHRLDIPFNHLTKVVQQLGRGKFILTKKGKGGGVRLAVNPRQLTLQQVIEAVEGPIVISDCLFHRQHCRFSSRCRARRSLGEIRDRLRRWLAAVTIGDLVPSS